MLVSQADFIAVFPEFSDPVAFPPAQFAFWEALAETQLSERRFGKALPLALMLFVAHNISLSAQAAQTMASGGSPGGSIAAVASEAVGSVSVSYDTADSSIEGAGEWNSTSYGQRLYRMIKSFGTGPVYVAQAPSFSAQRGLGLGYRRF